jgi:hypothetical protein
MCEPDLRHEGIVERGSLLGFSSMQIPAFKLMAMGVALVSPVALAAQARRPPTLEDLLAVKTIGAAALSPDGRFVAYGVREANFAQDAYLTRLWLASTESGAPYALTTPGKNVPVTTAEAATRTASDGPLPNRSEGPCPTGRPSARHTRP